MPTHRITIVLPFVHLTGGIRMMLDHANALHRAGHQVLVTYPAWPYRFHLTRRQQLHELRGRVTMRVRVPWFSLDAPLRRIPMVRSGFLPRADIVVATSWPTVHDVARLSPSRGQKVPVLAPRAAPALPGGSMPPTPCRSLASLCRVRSASNFNATAV